MVDVSDDELVDEVADDDWGFEPSTAADEPMPSEARFSERRLPLTVAASEFAVAPKVALPTCWAPAGAAVNAAAVASKASAVMTAHGFCRIVGRIWDS